jgi:hypothetical protein
MLSKAAISRKQGRGMKLKYLRAKDFYAGLIFIFFGIIALWEGRHYAMGTAGRMGPGYLPKVLGVILILLGAGISGRTLWSGSQRIEPFALRPVLLVTIAVLAFTFLLQPLGLVLVVLIMVTIGTIGSGDFRLIEAVLLYLFLSVLTVSLFVYLLKIPLRVWP